MIVEITVTSGERVLVWSEYYWCLQECPGARYAVLPALLGTAHYDTTTDLTTSTKQFLNMMDHHLEQSIMSCAVMTAEKKQTKSYCYWNVPHKLKLNFTHFTIIIIISWWTCRNNNECLVLRRRQFGSIFFS